MGSRISRGLLHAVVLLLCAAWLTPTVGFLVSSFRPARQIATTGWSTALSPPFTFILDLYREALSASWMGQLVALVYLGGTPRVAPLPLAIANQVISLGANWQVVIAGAFISMVLPLLVFFSLQRYFVRGILAGSVKT